MKLFDNRPLELIALTRNQKVCGFASRKRNPFRYPRPEPPTVYNLCRGDLNYYRLAISTPEGGGEGWEQKRCLCNSRRRERERENCKNPFWSNEVAGTEQGVASRVWRRRKRERERRKDNKGGKQGVGRRHPLIYGDTTTLRTSRSIQFEKRNLFPYLMYVGTRFFK